MLEALAGFASAHPLVYSLLVWPLLTALVTGAFGALGHLSDDDFAKLPKPLAWLLGVLAASGLDAPKVLQLLASLFRKAPPLAMLVALLSLPPLACSWLQSSQAAQDAGMAVKDTICVIDHDQEPVSQIISDCGLIGDASSLAVQIAQILEASHAAEKRALSASDAGHEGGMRWYVDAAAGK